MNNERMDGILWVGIALVLALEFMAFLFLTGKGDDPGPKPDRAPSAPPLATVPFPSSEVVEDRRVAGVPSLDATAGADSTAERSIRAAEPWPLQALAQQVEREHALPREALLTFKTPEGYADFLARAGHSGLVVKGKLDELRTARVGFDSLEQLRAGLLGYSASDVQAGANYRVALPRPPTPGARGAGDDLPFGDTVLAAIGIRAEVNRSQWGQGVMVAVLDSGVGEHPSFRQGQITHVDLVNDGLPFEGHGTAIASLIAGDMAGAQGVSPGADILDIRVADSLGESNSFLLAQGIATALKRGAKVINISMGSYGDAAALQAAVEQAVQRGVPVVASAGNEQASVKAWPAAYPGVISVSGVDASGRPASFSNTGSPTLAAPAVGIPSAYLENNRAYLATGSGTSQSAALVSGAVASILSRGGNVMLTLTRNAQRLSAPPEAVGAGMLRLPAGW